MAPGDTVEHSDPEMKQGDTVQHITTGRQATVIAIDGLWLRLEHGRGSANDLSRYWRRVCPK